MSNSPPTQRYFYLRVRNWCKSLKFRCWYRCNCPCLCDVRSYEASRAIWEACYGDFQLLQFWCLQLQGIGTTTFIECRYPGNIETVASGPFNSGKNNSVSGNHVRPIPYSTGGSILCRYSLLTHRFSSIGHHGLPVVIPRYFLIQRNFNQKGERIYMPAKIRWLELGTGAKKKVFDDTQIFGYGPRVCLGRE